MIYFNTASLDGYIAGPFGRWEWATPDPEVHAFVDELLAPVTTHLYNLKVYEAMKMWDDVRLEDLSPPDREFALRWRDVDKIVYTRKLTSVSTRRTELRDTFDAEEGRRLKDSTLGSLAIGGGQLASIAARAGLLDEVHVVVAPAVVGGGIRLFDKTLRLDLELFDEHRFRSGFVHLGYRVRRASR
nr:dihydrofolate reductase family protein [Microbacterium ureisolvens]